MKTSRNDIFDLDLCISGLGNQLTFMHTDIYLFMYSMTFRSSQTASEKEFKEAMKNGEKNLKIFANSKNLDIRLCARIQWAIIKFKQELCSIWGIDERKDLADEMLREQAMRYSPRLIGEIKRRNYLKMSLSYAKILTGFVRCLNSYVCAITIQSYKIPMVPDKQVILCDKHSLDLPVENEKMVRFINNLLAEIIDDIEKYQDQVDRSSSILDFLGRIQR